MKKNIEGDEDEAIVAAFRLDRLYQSHGGKAEEQEDGEPAAEKPKDGDGGGEK